ncbi:MAG: hypothetical protein MZV70_11850 [Desulfobacterales bacterium]|nr:hypothetical protein [Desulfobacterales bacterium]
MTVQGCTHQGTLPRNAKGCADIDVVEASLGGVGLLDLMTGYDKVIIVDAVFTAKNSLA